MSSQTPEPTLRDRIDEHPSFSVGEALKVKPRDLVIRFIAGALTSIGAGAVTLAFGARVGGLLLAFPAILAASLTLIEEQEDSADAREDSRGAIVGGVALTIFAAVGTLGFGHLSGSLVLLIAAAAWSLTAISIYRGLWWR